MMLIALGLVAGLVTAPPANIKGKWEGTVTAQREDGSTSNDTVLMILDQTDAKVTGTVGGNEGDQHPITNGTVEDNKVVLAATHVTNGREYRIELTVENDEMKGVVKTGERTGQVVVKKRKE